MFVIYSGVGFIKCLVDDEISRPARTKMFQDEERPYNLPKATMAFSSPPKLIWLKETAAKLKRGENMFHSTSKEVALLGEKKKL